MVGFIVLILFVGFVIIMGHHWEDADGDEDKRHEIDVAIAIVFLIMVVLSIGYQCSK